jgi:chemotaxis protein CheZ
MSPETATAAVAQRLAQLGDDPAEPVSLGEVTEIVESIVATMDSDMPVTGLQMTQQIAALAQVIQSAKAEIAALDPDEIRAHHIPAATDELDAVVGAAAEATHAIMEAAEAVEGVAEELGEAQARTLTDAVTTIYEACSFQDITGQRISKVIRALREIETKVDAMLVTLGDEAAVQRQEARAREAAADQRSDQDLLHGPQLEGDGQAQDDIDALFASFD